jgi:hypothetical protein
MIAPFDIFKVDAPGGMLWIEAVAELEPAKARVAALMETTPSEYLISSQKTGHKISIKPRNLTHEVVYMPCKSCGSANQRKFSAEMGIHFPEKENIDKPAVWVFPEVVVCFNCGMAEFSVPKAELRQLEQSDSASSQ